MTVWETRAFKNERGRKIDLEVCVGGAGPGAVRVTMMSPDTCDEGFYTRLEAEHLRDALIAALKEGASRKDALSCEGGLE